MRELIFFVKAPEAGKVKSRLAAEVGEEAALGLYKKVALQTLDAVGGGQYDLKIAFLPRDAKERVSEWLGDCFHYTSQKGGGLGERMENAFRDAFSRGADRAVLVGSDIPDLNRERVEEAFAALDKHAAVINPTFDGGYCLIGFRADGFSPVVFRGIKWGTDAVFEETMSAFLKEGVSAAVLSMLRDLDRADDLKHFPGLFNSKKFSVIVPVLHEAENIHPLIRHIRSLPGSEDCEIIVVDGSPDGDTLVAIKDGGVGKISSAKGRARQMNAGATVAEGQILVFLHADTLLPEDAFRKISEALDGRGCVGGAFDLLLDSAHPFIRFVSWSAGLRSRLTRIPYGDQAIFMRRDYFEEIGGYREIPLMEDVELMRRVKRLGGRIRILDEPARTSARKYIEDGPVYSALRNHVLRLLFVLGVSPERLERFYYRN